MSDGPNRFTSPARLSALAAAVAISAAALSGCSPPAAERPEIVVTTNILGDVVGQLAADQRDEITVRTLMRPDADPHSFEISAQEAAAMESAELVVSNGLGLEEGLEQHLESAAEAGTPRVVATDFVDVLRTGSRMRAVTTRISGPIPRR